MEPRLVAASAALMILGVTAARAGVPPAGFRETEVVTGITLPTGFDWVPNGDLWLISKLGTAYVLHSGSSQPVPALTLNVDTRDERGLVGIVVDPNFATNHFIYLYYTKPTTPARNRVSRFTAAGDTLVGETPLLEGPDLTTLLHNSGCLRFGTDGLLYISMGNNSRPGVEQQLDNLLGKILRIAPDGSIPPNNPFVGVPGARPEIWAYGLRNPWRFSIQPVTGTLFIGDVGDAGWEELDLGVPRANYGYPYVEGPSPPGVAGMTYPIYSYPHSGTSASITAGDHMVSGNFPPQYAGDYFFGDYARDQIYRLRLDASNAPISVELFVDVADSPVHIRVGPDGALYYASVVAGKIFRVAYVGGSNQQPVAVAAASTLSGISPLPIQFDGSGSCDPDGGSLSYRWFFGDETPSSTSTSPSHTYSSTGVFFPNLTVDDGQDTDVEFLRIVSGNRAPVATITAPVDGARFNGGDTIPFSGGAFDPEDGALGPSALTWTVLFHHGTHTHPHLGPTPGISGGSFTALAAGEPDPDVWYEIRLTAADSGAPLGSNATVSDARSVAIYPNLSTLRFESAPRGDLALALDGRPVTAPLDVFGVVGLHRPLEAISPQTAGDGHTYVFLGWSDGGARTHEIIWPPADATFTASFGCDLQQIPDNLDLSPAPGGLIRLTWDPPADPCLTAGPAVYHVYAAPTRLPAFPPGDFPFDPPYFLRAVTATPEATFTPAPGFEYYIVVGIGSDEAEGPAGHYGR